MLSTKQQQHNTKQIIFEINMKNLKESFLKVGISLIVNALFNWLKKNHKEMQLEIKFTPITDGENRYFRMSVSLFLNRISIYEKFKVISINQKGISENIIDKNALESLQNVAIEARETIKKTTL